MYRRKSRHDGGYGILTILCVLVLLAALIFGWILLPAEEASSSSSKTSPDSTPTTVSTGGLGDLGLLESKQDTGDTSDGTVKRSDVQHYSETLEEGSLLRQLCEAVEQYKSEVDLPGYDAEAIKAAQQQVYRIPDYFYIDTFSYNDGWSGMTYRYSAEQIDSMQAEVDAAAAEALASVPAGAGEVETAMALHDWLCEHIVYTHVENSEDQSIYNGLVSGKCVCNGYAESYSYLLSLSGIDSTVLTGTAVNASGASPENHAWNSATLDGKLYYFDVTWDDDDDSGSCDYFWFAVTSARIGASHTCDEYSTAEPSAYTDANFYYSNGYVLDGFSVSGLTEQLQKQTGSTIYLLASDEDTFTQLVDYLQTSDSVALMGETGHGTAGFSTRWNDMAYCVTITC